MKRATTSPTIPIINESKGEIRESQLYLASLGGKQLHQAMKAIEVNHEAVLKQSYIVELVERKQTLKSVRWGAAGNGAKYAGVKTLNKRMELHGDGSV